MKVLFEKKSAVAYVTINRPERLNACDFETYAMLADIWAEFQQDVSLRVAIFTGAGDRAFCAGSDIKSNYVESNDVERTGAERSKSPYPVMMQLTKPVIAAINGHANGGGLEQALACDIRVAAEHAQFGLGEVRLGWLPGGGGTQRLPRLVPLGRALEMLYTGMRIDAGEALRLGLVDYVVPLNELMAKCERIAAEICRSAPLAVSKIKEVALRGLDLPLADGLRMEREAYEWLTRTEDAREGAQAFAQKRPPAWRGREIVDRYRERLAAKPAVLGSGTAIATKPASARALSEYKTRSWMCQTIGRVRRLQPAIQAKAPPTIPAPPACCASRNSVLFTSGFRPTSTAERKGSSPI
jgi:enoyl-CoA hydratase/carnithine racemase